MNTLVEHFKKYINSDHTLAFTEQENWSYRHFWVSVYCLKHRLEQETYDSYCLWEDNGYYFLVSLFALLLSNKKIYLPPNQLVSTLQLYQKKEIFNFKYSDYRIDLESDDGEMLALDSINWDILLNNCFLMQTSGSSGTPKLVERKLIQLFQETLFLSELGNISTENEFLVTVSHQHMFGLVYQLLLPLVTGASFFAEMILFTEEACQKIIESKNRGKRPVFVSSQAFLSRLSEKLPVQNLLIFTSGGPLSDDVKECYRQWLIEIYGSTETGGIAYSRYDNRFKLYNKVEIKTDELNQLYVRSPYSFTVDWYGTQDVIELKEEKTFLLKGRSSRLVKIQEKRISLDEVEKIIMNIPGINDVFVFIEKNENNREIIHAVCDLSDQAWQELKKIKKFKFVRQLKDQLKDFLENNIIPRRWRFVDKISRNHVNKINWQQINSLFQRPLTIPKYDLLEYDTKVARLSLFFNEELVYFQGHFPEQAIFPGVAQLSIVLQLTRKLFGLDAKVQSLEKIKFAKTIQLYDIVQLYLNTEDKNKLCFRIENLQEELISSGVLILSRTV